MSKFDALFESKFMKGLQSSSTKLASNKVFSAITGGMQGIMSLILVGAVFMITATILDLLGISKSTSELYQWLMVPYNMTMGLVALAMAFLIGYNYAKNLDMNPVSNGLISLVMFLLVAAPVTSVSLADKSTMSVLSSSYLGGTGLFTAILVPLISVQIIYIFKQNNFTIKMPESIPPFLAESFSSLIPLVVNVILWHGLNSLLLHFFRMNISQAIMAVLAVPLSGLNSVPGMFILGFLQLLFWVFGLHGTGIIFTVMFPIMAQYFASNAALVAAGHPPVFAPIALNFAISACGATGNLLPLSILCLRSKSVQLKTIGKAGIIPCLFNIGEPMIFGVPIMYNPILAIPFVVSPLVSMGIVYIGYMLNFFKPPYIFIMTSLPIGVFDFMQSMAWQNVFIPVVALIVGLLIYLPFVKAYEHQLISNEDRNSEASN